MNVTCFLSVILLCLVLYVAVRDFVVNRKRSDGSKNIKSVREDFASLDLPHKIEFISKPIFLALFLYLYFAHFSFFVVVMSIPSLIAYTLVFVLTLATTWKVIKSGERTQLTPLESNSLAFLGMILGFVGIARSVNFDMMYAENTVPIMHVFLLAIEYSAYLFFIASLAFLLITDCSRALIWCAARLSTKFHSCEERIRRNAFPHTRKCGCSVKLKAAFCAKRKWTRWLYVLPMLLTFTLDVFGYLAQYIFILVFSFPLFCLTELFRLICSFVLTIARCLCALSNRRITVIAFRLSIAAAMLLIVIMNRFGLITTTEATTSLLEFVASVLIIPIVLGWLQEALPNNSNKEDPNSVLIKDINKD